MGLSHRKGILAFATDGQSPYDNNTATLAQLGTFDQHRQPHISTRTAFAALSAAYRPPEIAPDTYLTQVVNQKRTYGTAANHDQEARAAGRHTAIRLHPRLFPVPSI